MSVYDIESLLASVKQLMVDNLNIKIAEINTEKNDDISMSLVDDAAYYMQSLDANQINFNPFIYYGVRDIDDAIDIKTNDSSIILNIDVAIVIEDSGQDVNISSKMFRYIRALKEVFEEGFDDPSFSGTKVMVQSLVPIEISLFNDSYTHKACGVSIKAFMG